MSRKKKVVLLVAATLALVVLATVGSVLYLHANPEGAFAQFLQRRGVPLEAILDQPQIATVGRKLGEFFPSLQVQARSTGQVATAASPAVFNGIAIKGVLGTSSDRTALISAEGKTHWLKVGEQFPVKMPKGIVTLRCEEIRPGSVVVGVANSDLRKEYSLH